MDYKRMSNETIQKFLYPNLIAEIGESGYDFKTIGKCLGYGSNCEDDDPRIMKKLFRKGELLTSEGFKLAKLFDVDPDYLFSNDLKIVDGKPAAYRRWRTKEGLQEEHDRLGRKPYLFNIMQEASTLNTEDLHELSEFVLWLKSGGGDYNDKDQGLVSGSAGAGSYS